MIKSIFVDPLEIDGIEKSGANHLIVTEHEIDKDNWQKLQALGVTLGISVDAFIKGGCSADPQARERLFKQINTVLDFQPDEIWLDHFRFGGECTGINEADVNLVHQECEWCRGKNRQEFINELARKVIAHIEGKSKIGLFAVAFKKEEAPSLGSALGLDYSALGQIFDMFSPMLYHRMIGKPVSYISEYVSYLVGLTGKPALPIIQIKDMPDDLEDRMSEEDIRQAFNEAKKAPSVGVCFFWWKHALEKNKTEIISKLLQEE